MTDNCPNCKHSLQGEPIPEYQRHNYGDRTHFSTKIGLYDRGRDMTVAYKCPYCNYQWSTI